MVEGWLETNNNRKVFKFRLVLIEDLQVRERERNYSFDHAHLIPTHVKREVWKRDKGRCVQCGSTNNLHFEHIIPYSKGGSSQVAENIQLLCACHNLEKRDKIQ